MTDTIQVPRTTLQEMHDTLQIMNQNTEKLLNQYLAANEGVIDQKYTSTKERLNCYFNVEVEAKLLLNQKQ